MKNLLQSYFKKPECGGDLREFYLKKLKSLLLAGIKFSFFAKIAKISKR